MVTWLSRSTYLLILLLTFVITVNVWVSIEDEQEDALVLSYLCAALWVLGIVCFSYVLPPF